MRSLRRRHAPDQRGRSSTTDATQYDERGWRATFYATGMEHSPTSATGTAWNRTPWHPRNGPRGR